MKQRLAFVGRCGIALALLLGAPAAVKAGQGPLEVMARTTPSLISVGETTTIEVVVARPGGAFAASALVTIDSGGGIFTGSGAASVSGRSDARGRFSATWHCQAPCAASSLMSVTASLPGFERSAPFPLWVEVAGGGVARPHEAAAAAVAPPPPPAAVVAPAPQPSPPPVAAAPPVAAVPPAPPQPAYPAPIATPFAQGWEGCHWVAIGAAKSLRPTEDWCESGSFLTQLDLEALAELDPHSSPIVANAKCCRPVGSAAAAWASCSWNRVGPRPSHEVVMDWCPAGSFLVQLELDGRRDAHPEDVPVISRARCCVAASASATLWGDCEWNPVGREGGHRPNQDWCGNGSFLTQLDLDGIAGIDAHESPVVAQARCCKPTR